jgi:hypothetical protein
MAGVARERFCDLADEPLFRGGPAGAQQPPPVGANRSGAVEMVGSERCEPIARGQNAD